MNEVADKIKKENSEIMCRCDNSQCAKCSGGNCKDESCQIHTGNAKSAFQIKTMKYGDLD